MPTFLPSSTGTQSWSWLFTRVLTSSVKAHFGYFQGHAGYQSRKKVHNMTKCRTNMAATMYHSDHKHYLKCGRVLRKTGWAYNKHEIEYMTKKNGRKRQVTLKASSTVSVCLNVAICLRKKNLNLNTCNWYDITKQTWNGGIAQNKLSLFLFQKYVHFGRGLVVPVREIQWYHFDVQTLTKATVINVDRKHSYHVMYQFYSGSISRLPRTADSICTQILLIQNMKS